MDCLFDHRVDRTGALTWLKDAFTPQAVKDAGLLGYAGAEFEFPTCPAIGKGIQAVLDKGILGFTLPNDAYRNAVCWWMENVRESKIEPDWILPTHGTIFSLATTIRLMTEPGDAIMILVPGYHRYEQAATRLGRNTVRIPLADADGRYTLDWAALETAMAQPRNRILVLTNPNNPTGNVYTRQELERIAALARKYQVMVFSDEIFADVAFDSPVLPYVLATEEKDLAISCTALGKTFSLTGVNHANVIIRNPELREKFQTQRNADHYGSVDPLIHAALVSVYTQEGKTWLKEMKTYVWRNFEIFRDFISANIPGAVVTQPEGSFVVWVDYGSCGKTRKELVKLLCEEGLFVGDEGEEFYGRPTCFRYCLAVPRKDLETSLAHLKTVLEKYNR